MRNDKVYYGIRIIAGIYVIYIACDTFRKVAAGETGKNAVPLTAASIAILAAGIAFVIWGIVSLKKKLSVQPERDPPGRRRRQRKNLRKRRMSPRNR